MKKPAKIKKPDFIEVPDMHGPGVVRLTIAQYERAYGQWKPNKYAKAVRRRS